MGITETATLLNEFEPFQEYWIFLGKVYESRFTNSQLMSKRSISTPTEKPSTPGIAGSIAFTFAKASSFKTEAKSMSGLETPSRPLSAKSTQNQSFQMNLGSIGSSVNSNASKSTLGGGDSLDLFTPRTRNIGSLMNLSDEQAFKKPLVREKYEKLSPSLSQTSFTPTPEVMSPKSTLYVSPIFAKRDASPPHGTHKKKQKQDDGVFSNSKSDYQKGESVSSSGSVTSRMSMGVEIQNVIERWEHKFDTDKERLKEEATIMTKRNRELKDINKRFEKASFVVMESLLKHKQALKISELK
jgi:hypothetical protein